MQFDKKKWLPHGVAVVIFLALSLFYCKPAIEGLGINQHDLIQWKGMAQDAFNYKEKHGHFPQWTNGLFSGMPSYNIAYNSNAILPAYIIKIMSMGLPEPISYFFLACICFYFLSQVLRVNPWIGILGSIGFAFCSYDPIIIAVGHHTKMVTMALMPALLGALLLLYEKRYWLGGALIAAFTAALVVNNHLQIIYYMMIVVLFVTAAYVIRWIRQGEFKHLFLAGGIALASAGVGALTSAVNLFTTYDYSKESMRGGKAPLVLSDTASGQGAKATTGLDAEYAFRWSYGKSETLSLLVPNVHGGASESLGEDSKFYSTLMEAYQSKQIDEGTAQQVSRFGSAYWGDQPFTSGPVYLGAVICLLFALGMVAKGNKHSGWALACSVLAILMAWGSNFAAFNNFLFEYLPMYNKFRAPAMILVIPQMLFPLVAIVGLQQLVYGEASQQEKWKLVKNTGIVAGVFLLITLVVYSSASFSSATEQETVKQLTQANPTAAPAIKSILSAAADDRRGMFMDDFIRSLAFVAAGFALLWAIAKGRLSTTIAVSGLLILTTFDLLAVGRRYLNENNFEEKDDLEATSYVAASNPPLYQALTGIQKDTDPHYRVFNVTGDVFNDALTSAFVRSIGGYHPAKLSIYQDLIENQLSSANPNMEVLNMLNTRYFVVPTPQGPQVQQNPFAYGPAWLVKGVSFVKDAASEMRALNTTNLRDTAVIQDTFKTAAGPVPAWDSTASVQLVKYDNESIEYQVNAPKPQFAVLSDIYYSRGWNAYGDGKSLPIVKANYVLRGVAIPAGVKKLELKFEPESYKVGYGVTTAASVLVVILLVVGGYFQFRKRRTRGNA